jgi:hypothetical protein
MNDLLQTAAVVVIEALAVAWLVSRFVTRRLRRPRILTKPDVKASALVRKSSTRKNRPTIIRD